MDLASALQTLYGVNPSDFVAERDRLAKELKAAGHAGEAAELRKLRKPPATVWALNQVARWRGALIDTLLGEGARMVQMHAALARGKAGEDFKDVSARYRQAIAAVVAAAREVLESTGGGAVDAGTVRRVERTLEAAVFASEAQQQALEQGTLAEELERADAFDTVRFEVAAGVAPRAPAPAPVAKAPARVVAEEADGQAERVRQSERRRQAREAKAAAQAAEREATRAAAVLERAEKEARKAVERRDTAVREMTQAEAAFAASQERASAAHADAATSEAHLAEARKSAAEAAEAAERAARAAAAYEDGE